MKTFAQIQQPTQPALPPPPSNLGEWGFLASAAVWGVGGLAVFGRKLGDWFLHKEQTEASLTASLIGDLREDRSKVVESNQAGFAKLADKLDTLNNSIVKSSGEVDRDVQSVMKTQSAIYASLNQSIGRLEAAIKALHDRMDDSGNFSQKGD